MIPHRAAGYPPVRPGDVHVYVTGKGYERAEAIARTPWFACRHGVYARWYTHETGPILLGDRVIPGPRIPPTGGWGHRRVA